MSRTIEAALVFPISLSLLLASASLAFPAYAAVRRQARAENRETRLVTEGKSIYRAYYGEAELPQLESHVDAFIDSISTAADNVQLFKRILETAPPAQVKPESEALSETGASP